MSSSYKDGYKKCKILKSIHSVDSPALVSVSARGKGQQKGAKKVFESASVWEP
jgi:hypothetical protein